MATVVEGDLLGAVENYIQTNKVMIFSKSRCPYCAKVSDDFKVISLKILSYLMRGFVQYYNNVI